MKTPRTDKTGTAALIAILTTALGIATGLCGINFVSVILFVPLSGGTPPGRFINGLGEILSVAGVAELMVIAVSLVALAVLGIGRLVGWMFKRKGE